MFRSRSPVRKRSSRSLSRGRRRQRSRSAAGSFSSVSSRFTYICVDVCFKLSTCVILQCGWDIIDICLDCFAEHSDFHILCCKVKRLKVYVALHGNLSSPAIWNHTEKFGEWRLAAKNKTLEQKRLFAQE